MKDSRNLGLLVLPQSRDPTTQDFAKSLNLTEVILKTEDDKVVMKIFLPDGSRRTFENW